MTQGNGRGAAVESGSRILYLDDDESLVVLITRLLQRKGCRVSGYTDAREALAAVRAHPGDFDLVITDYNMPGMSGLDVAIALREIRHDLPVALASGYISQAVQDLAPAAGVREIFHKTDLIEDLCDAVARWALLPGGIAGGN
jgi:CheY-like chemotaxis protein